MSNMVVRTNVFALNAHRNMKNVGVDQIRASQRLSSGFRINSAADDAAGLGISESMRAQIRGLDQASRNSQDGQALITTAEGGMQEIQNMLQRVRELIVQAANDTNAPDNRRRHIHDEIGQMLDEIDQMATRIEFNGMLLLDDSFTDPAAGLQFQVGANSGQLMGVGIGDMRLEEGEGLATIMEDFRGDVRDAMPLSDTITAADISNLLTTVDEGIAFISNQRANLGAISNRLDFTMRSLDISSENLSDAESRVRNTDMAREMMRFTMSSVLQQAAVSMLAQSNQLPTNLLQLLR